MLFPITVDEAPLGTLGKRLSSPPSISSNEFRASQFTKRRLGDEGRVYERPVNFSIDEEKLAEKISS